MSWLARLELRQRLLIALIAVDHLCLVLLTLGDCRRGETMSASAWRQERAGRWQGRLFRPLIDLLFSPIERDHCYWSWRAERHMHQPQNEAQP